MRKDIEMQTLPFGPDDQVREEILLARGIGEKVERKQAGDTLVRPGETVNVLYQLIDGSVDLIRDLGTAKQTLFRSYSRDERKMGSSVDWTPILGGRYFFLKKASSLHYVVTSPSKLLLVTPTRVRKLYAQRDCVKLVRELIRNSDLAPDVFLEELDRRYDALHYVGFCKDRLDTLLGSEEKYAQGDTEARAEAQTMMRDAYIDYACDMIFRLMGDMVEEDRGESTNIAINLPPVLR